MIKLKSSFRKFTFAIMANPYGRSVSLMTTDMLRMP